MSKEFVSARWQMVAEWESRFALHFYKWRRAGVLPDCEPIRPPRLLSRTTLAKATINKCRPSFKCVVLRRVEPSSSGLNRQVTLKTTSPNVLFSQHVYGSRRPTETLGLLRRRVDLRVHQVVETQLGQILLLGKAAEG